jgi:hypothetical protein
MSLNANFTGVQRQVVEGAAKLKVEGKSIPQTGADRIFVTMTHNSGTPELLPVQQPGRVTWDVLFDEDPADPFATGDLIFVVGLAMRTDGVTEPFVWQGSFTID